MPGPRKLAGHDHSKVFVVNSGGDFGVVDGVNRDRIQLEEESDVDTLGFMEVHATLVTPCNYGMKSFRKWLESERD